MSAARVTRVAMDLDDVEVAEITVCRAYPGITGGWPSASDLPADFRDALRDWLDGAQ